MRALVLVAAIASLGACGLSPAPDADQVSLKGDRLAVYLSDGTVCRANMSGSGQGAFPGCPHDVRFDLRRHANPGFIAPHAPELVEPFADITIMLPGGRSREFMTPASRYEPGWLVQEDS
ncbi:MAG: hypothetical protein Q4F71_05200 [Paracoccus sp. (in: a-proteobacteria)]|nr:hypothetical protein [Paracoccus sp. (in: a-proteobacteria)]